MASQLEGSPRVERLLADLRTALLEMQQDPTNPIPAYNSGVIYGQLGDYASAARSYRIAIERNPSFFQGHYNLGTAYAEQGLWQEAEAAYRQGLQYNDKDPEAWANLGNVYQHLNQPEQALEAYRRALELDPKDSAVRLRMGLIYYDQGDLPRARDLFEHALQANGSSAEAWNYLGLVDYHLGRLEEAQRAYRTAIQVDGQYAQAWNNLGNLFAAQGDTVAAEQHYRQAAARAPNDPDIWFNLGEHFFKRKHPECERCLWRAVELRPQDYEAWELLRQWYRHNPHYPHWRNALEALLRVQPERLELRRELAFVLEHLGDNTAALEQLRMVVAEDAQDHASRIQLAKLHLKQNQLLEAFAQLSQVDSAEKEVLDLRRHVGERLLHHGHAEQAGTCFLSVVAHEPWRTELWQHLGELAFQREQWDVAFERFCRAEEMNRDQRGTWWPLAERFMALGNARRAAECLDRLPGLWPCLPEEWPAAFSIYLAAGRAKEFLAPIFATLEQGLLDKRHWAGLARLYEQAGLPEQARACLKHVESEQQERERLRAQARALLERQQAGPALELLRRIEHLSLMDAGYWVLLGDVQSFAGQLEEARAAYEKALSLAPEDFRAWFKLGNVRFRLQHYAEAEAAFRQAAALNGNEPKTWYNLGCTQAETARLEEARESFERVLKLDRRFAQAWNWLGIIHFNRKNVALARRCYVRCVAINRQSGTGWHNLAALYQFMGRQKEADYCKAQSARYGGAGAQDGLAPVKLFHDRDPREPQA